MWSSRFFGIRSFGSLGFVRAQGWEVEGVNPKP